MIQKILCVDDDPDILELISSTLRKEGYHIDTATDGKEALAVYEQQKNDIILLDIMMPGIDGIEVCKAIRQNHDKNPVIIFLTAKTDEIDQILGLEIGADDYMMKPFSPKILKSKIKSIIRRQGFYDSSDHSKIVTSEGIEVDKQTYTVKVDGEEIRFLRKEFELLHYLMSKKNRVHTRDELLSHVWGEDAYFVDRTVDVHITKIRKKIKPYDKIKTVSGIGYKFI